MVIVIILLVLVVLVLLETQEKLAGRCGKYLWLSEEDSLHDILLKSRQNT